MSNRKKKRRPTLAEALNATEWDFVPDPERKMLLRPVGSIFENLPWEVDPQYLGPAPIEGTETEDHSESAGAPGSLDNETTEP